MTVREILKILHNDGWVEKDYKGSHIQLAHPTKTGKVTVPKMNYPKIYCFKLYFQ